MNRLPLDTEMYKALLEKDSTFEGIFFAGIKTTGIFCRPTCSAKKPKKENVEFFSSAKDALLHGYRPCKICNPLEKNGVTPGWMKNLMSEIEINPSKRIKDYDLVKQGINPHRLRRWFKKNHGMTFQTYLRTLRIGEAFGRIKYGDKVIEAALSSEFESISSFNTSFKKTLGLNPTESKAKQIITVTRILTPLGPMLAGALADRICLLEFIDRKMIETQLKRIKKIFNAEIVPGTNQAFPALEKELTEYFAGERKEFNVKLAFNGTSFQVKVWEALKEIPYGKTVSYKEQAVKVGVTAVRAVGKANGDNRIAIIIPCHRVIGSNGNLVGYGGGIWRKRFLLDLEKKHSL
jgi:AraC family transcriptional regulator of adaptative response/methylated-DNA-[protein]-cysteine methyltransferase